MEASKYEIDVKLTMGFDPQELSRKDSLILRVQSDFQAN